MNSQKLRSPRDPEFWIPLAIALALVLALAVGVWVWMGDFNERMRALAVTDPGAALDQTLSVLRLATLILCVLLAAFGIYFFRYCQLGYRQGRLPPSGWWSYGALRAIVGDRARRMARLGQILAVVLLLASIGFGLAVDNLVRLMQSGGLAA